MKTWFSRFNATQQNANLNHLWVPLPRSITRWIAASPGSCAQEARTRPTGHQSPS